jgi:signal transduction histidine kinase
MTTQTQRAPTLLVVEDSPTQAEALRAFLEEDGYAVRIARDADAALAMLEGGGAVDLVLSDVVMPGRSGYELCRAIKSTPALQHLPVVLLTSLADPMDIIRGLESGADNYITKPYDPAQLAARLHHVFENRALRRAARTAVGVDITFLGARFTITSEKEQILDMLLSSFEELIRTNDALRVSQEELIRSNEALRASQAERERLHEREREARVAAEAARERAEEANRAKSEFLTSMSHDLRTPLNAIGGYVDLIEMGLRGPVTAEQKSDLDRIRRNQQHLLALVTDVLNFARLERAQLTLRMLDVPLTEVMASARAAIEPQIRAKGIVFEHVPCSLEAVVHADRERAEQVLINLLTNALKFTPPDGRIALHCDETQRELLLRVTDTGIGIPPERLDDIFDPFVQIDARRVTSVQGVGLGLAISRTLARMMGGDVTVESRVGEGSTFTFRLPRAAAPAPEPLHSAPAARPL